MKDLLVVYFVIALQTLSFVMGREKVRVTTSGAFQMAVDLDFMLRKVFESEVIGEDEVYLEKLKQLKEIVRWRRFIRMLLGGTSQAARDSKGVALEIGDLKELKTAIIKNSNADFVELQKSLSMFEI